MEIKPYILDDQLCDKCETSNEKCPTLFCPEADCLLVSVSRVNVISYFEFLFHKIILSSSISLI